MSELPHGWAEVRLDELAEEVTGSIAPESAAQYELYSVPAFPEGNPELVDGSAIGSNKRPVAPADVLLCKINPRINRVWYVGPIKERRQLASTEFVPLRLPTGNEITARYLMWYLRSPRFREWIKLNAEGATGSHTRAKSPAILRQCIPIAPVSEQHRIVATIEEQFSRLDSGRAALDRVRLNVEAFKTALLDAEILGPGNSDASDLIADRLPALPPEWRWCTLDELREPDRPIVYGIIKPGPNVAGGVPYVRVTEMKDGHIDPYELRRASPARAKLFQRASLRGGDILISKDGTIGKVAVVPPELEGANITQHLVRLSLRREFNRDYVVTALRSRWPQRWLNRETRGVALQGVNVGDFRRLPLPIPPRPLQDAIQERVAAWAEPRGTRVIQLRCFRVARLPQTGGISKTMPVCPVCVDRGSGGFGSELSTTHLRCRLSPAALSGARTKQFLSLGHSRRQLAAQAARRVQ